MAEFRPHNHKCPSCRTEHPDWKRHAVYERYLISFENGHTLTYQVSVTRYKCSSCGHTHAVLPELLIPYKSYSLLFILSVMRDYFIGALTVEGICAKYTISVSTLYSWKKLFLMNKKLWLGLLDDFSTSSLQFLDYLLNQNLLLDLKKFFLTTGISFLQGVFIPKNASYSPP